MQAMHYLKSKLTSQALPMVVHLSCWQPTLLCIRSVAPTAASTSTALLIVFQHVSPALCPQLVLARHLTQVTLMQSPCLWHRCQGVPLPRVAGCKVL